MLENAEYVAFRENEDVCNDVFVISLVCKSLSVARRADIPVCFVMFTVDLCTAPLSSRNDVIISRLANRFHVIESDFFQVVGMALEAGE